MAKDIYHWTMSARAHRDSIQALISEILEAWENQENLAVSIITDLLPLQTNQASEINARGTFMFSENDFVNESDSDLWIEFFDPVIEEFYTTLPATWNGALSYEEGVLTITFKSLIEMEVPRISSMGINRSAFQIVESIQVSQTTSITKLIDSTDSGKETWIQADMDAAPIVSLKGFKLYELDQGTEVLSARQANPIAALIAKENEEGCGPAPDDPEWYVYRRNSGHYCIVHHGIMIGSNGYTKRYGPDTKAGCDNWVNNNCDEAYQC